MGACAGGPCGRNKQRSDVYRDQQHSKPPQVEPQNQMNRVEDIDNGGNVIQSVQGMQNIQAYRDVIRSNSAIIRRQETVSRLDQIYQTQVRIENRSAIQQEQMRGREDEQEQQQNNHEENILPMPGFLHLLEQITNRDPNMEDPQTILILMVLGRLLRPAPQEQGLNNEQINSLRVFQATQEGTCAICQDDIKIQQLIIGLPCTHPFHQACLRPWLEKARKCPLCREHVIRE